MLAIWQSVGAKDLPEIETVDDFDRQLGEPPAVLSPKMQFLRELGVA